MAFDFPSSPTLGQTYSVSGGPTYVYNGTAWQVLTPGGQFARVTFTATAGQTTFSTNYIVGAIDVFHNGVKLAPADFTATNGTSVVLVSPANAGDTIEVVSYAQVNYTNTVQKTGDTMTGSLDFSGNGLRITGDFSNATIANRLLFQTSTANNSTALSIAPNGTDTLSAFTAFGNSGVTNSPIGQLRVDGSNDVRLVSSYVGTSSYLPMTFYTGGSERLRIDTSGNVGIGTSSPLGRFTSERAAASAGWVLAGKSAGVSNESGVYIDGSNNAELAARNGSGTLTVRIGSTGNSYITGGSLGIGTSSPSSRLHVKNGSNAIENYPSGAWAGQFYNAADDVSQNGLVVGNRYASTVSTVFEVGSLYGGGSGSWGTYYKVDGVGTHSFGTSSQIIRSGEKFRVLINEGCAAIRNTNNSGFPTLHLQNSGAVAAYVMAFSNSAGEVGTITTNSGSTSYNTSSDYRLKEDVEPMQNGLATISALSPVTYTWKADGVHGEGFIAHELAEHVPLAVTGEKDAVDDEGNIKPQSVDYSKVVVHLVAAVKELSAKLDAAEARIAALEGAAA